MILKKKHVIASAPYRITLGGGGTDLPFYASKKGGFLISAAIDEYITVLAARRTLDKDIFLQYSKIERSSSVENIQHKILKELLRYYKIKDSFQLATFSTMPKYTGLGASSTLIVAGIKALREISGLNYSKLDIAKEAFHIEREILGLSGGFQDQYISALGGIQMIEINTNLEVKVNPLKIELIALNKIQKSLFLIHTSTDRSSEKIIEAQKKEFKVNENLLIEVYDRIKEIGKNAVNDLISGNINNLGKEMDLHWKIKKSITSSISSSKLDDMYVNLKSYGALGGKIIGAGGGGFFLMVVEKNFDLYRSKVEEHGYKIIDFSFEFKGVHSL